MTTAVQERQERKTFVAPRVNIIEQADTVTLEAELPGVPKDQVDVQVKNNELTITGHRVHTSEGQLRASERPRADFRRVFTLSRAIDQEKVDAHMENGLLTVTLYKTDSMRPRKIEIK